MLKKHSVDLMNSLEFLLTEMLQSALLEFSSTCTADKQIVPCGKADLKEIAANNWVCQGIVLSPVLFALYIDI